MTDAEKIRVVVIKNGVAKELHNLPGEIMTRLEEAYDEAPIRGLSHDTYTALVEFFSSKLVAYEKELASIKPEEWDMFTKTVAFAHAFDIYPQESPALFDMILTIERSINEREGFDSKSISMKEIKALINMDWTSANKDFRKWARKLFEDTGLKIGIVRMSKFFYGIITQMQVQMA